jgi:hypothetical protein
MIEGDRITELANEPEKVMTPSASGRGQEFVRCPKCRLALWSHYSSAGPVIKFVRVGTLDQPDHLPPDIHIFTSTKQPWIALAPGKPVVKNYYDRNEHWPAESLARYEALLPAIEAYRLGREAANA